ncbi:MULTISPECIES: ATP-binding protein [unclassified Streptomyces]|uniref:sensor histidine kinase n=1 Tax=unclassified Streptomyces TaxID=2593676 RepID=UPI002B1D001F|nr:MULTISPECIES: ATP-binding protein [unclassified Streptomyces]
MLTKPRQHLLPNRGGLPADFTSLSRGGGPVLAQRLPDRADRAWGAAVATAAPEPLRPGRRVPARRLHATRRRRCRRCHRQRRQPGAAHGVPRAILSKGGLGPALRARRRGTWRARALTEVAVFYGTSECLTNAVKHARVGVVAVTAGIEGDILEVTITEDGTGSAEPGRGSGLGGLVDRVEAIGGRLTISSPPDRGTTLTVRLPLSGPSPDM